MVSDQASRAGRKPPERFPMTSLGKAVEIRVATALDVEGILACLHSAFERYRREFTPSAYTATVLTSPMAKRRVRSMTVLVGLDSKGRIIGTVAVKRSSPGRAHLRGMAVLPQYQGKGVALGAPRCRDSSRASYGPVVRDAGDHRAASQGDPFLSTARISQDR